MIHSAISILGCGWLGKPLAIHLIEQGFTVNGSTTSISKLDDFSKNGIHPFLISLETFNETHIDFLNVSTLIIALPSKNIEGFKNLLYFIEKSTVKNVLFISSTSVYPSNNMEVTEEMELPPSPLLEIETIFRNNSNFKATILRFSGLFGNTRKPGNWFKNGRTIPNPDGFVNMIHLDDCIGVISTILQQEKWNEVFNGCADTHPSRKDFYTKTKNDILVEPPIFENGTTIVSYKIVSNKKVKKLLNYTFKYGNLLEIDYNDSKI